MPSSKSSETEPDDRGQCKTIDLGRKLAAIDGFWQPRVVAEMNDYQFKVVKLEGEFVWHAHADTDETFVVLDGELEIDIRGVPSAEPTLSLRAGQMAVVPKGVEHRPRALGEVRVLLIEPRGVVNTGDGVRTERTAENYRWI